MSKTKKITRARKARDEALKELEDCKRRLRLAEERNRHYKSEWKNVCECIENALPKEHLLRMIAGEVFDIEGEHPDYLKFRTGLIESGPNGYCLEKILYKLEVEYKENWNEFTKILGIRTLDGYHDERFMLDRKAMLTMPMDVLVRDVTEQMLKEMQKSQRQY